MGCHRRFRDCNCGSPHRVSAFSALYRPGLCLIVCWLRALANQVTLFLFADLVVAVARPGECWAVLADAKRASIFHMSLSLSSSVLTSSGMLIACIESKGIAHAIKMHSTCNAFIARSARFSTAAQWKLRTTQLLRPPSQQNPHAEEISKPLACRYARTN